jgi:hypothetical protein
MTYMTSQNIEARRELKDQATRFDRTVIRDHIRMRKSKDLTFGKSSSFRSKVWAIIMENQLNQGQFLVTYFKTRKHTILQIPICEKP